MDADNMRATADFIERENFHFNMTTWGIVIDAQDPIESQNFCGTYACVAGAANLVRHTNAYKRGAYTRPSYLFTADAAMEFLGLDDSQAAELFEGSKSHTSLESITRKRPLVPTALRYMADTGDVHWTRALAAAQCYKDKQKEAEADAVRDR